MVPSASFIPPSPRIMYMTLIYLISVLTGAIHSSYRENDKRIRATGVGGQVISSQEKVAIVEVRNRIADFRREGRWRRKEARVSEWLWSCTDVDIVRFLRGNKGDVDAATTKILAHAQWRVGPSGAEQILRDESFYASAVNLHREVFWLDATDINGCPTVVVRALLHDGDTYDEVPQKFTNFLIYLLEKGREKLGVGNEKMACLVLDRYPVVTGKQGSSIKNKEIFDLSVIPNILALLRYT